MNCYDCAQHDTISPALAVCHDCGAGVCVDHSVEASHHDNTELAVGSVVRPKLRLIHCHQCEEACTKAQQPRANAS